MEIVCIDLCHVRQIALLEQVCFSDPWSERSITAEISNPLSKWFVAVEGDTVVGYIGSQTVLGESDMMNVAVSPEFRGRGIGEKLVQTLIDWLKDNQVYRLTLEVRVSNEPAIKLYEKLGFTQIGRRPNYYHHPKEDAYIMGKELLA